MMTAAIRKPQPMKKRLPRLDPDGPSCPVCAPAQRWPKGWSGAQVLVILCTCARRRQSWGLYSSKELEELIDAIPQRSL